MLQWLKNPKQGLQAFREGRFWKWYKESGAHSAFNFLGNCVTIYLVYYIVSQGETLGRSIDCQAYHPLIVAASQCPYGVRADLCVGLGDVVWNTKAWSNYTGQQTKHYDILNNEQKPKVEPEWPKSEKRNNQTFT